MGNFKPSVYQQDIFNFITNETGSAIVQAVAGCLAGETLVRFNRAGKGFSMSLKKAFLRFNSQDTLPNSNWNQTIPTMVRSFTGEEIRLHKIQNIVESGVKEVFKLTLSNGNSIKATANHEFMTNSGWIQLQNLELGMHTIMCDNINAESFGSCEKRHDEMVRGLKFHPYGSTDARGVAKRVALHCAVYEANMNGLLLDEYVNILKTDEVKSNSMKFVDSSKYDIHHKDFDPSNNSVNNLEVILRKDHKKLHANGQHKNFNQGVPQYCNIQSIEPCGSEMTYDIVCEDPHRNFVANTMVVHNSGKTTTIVEALELIPSRNRILFCAFNKSIANELQERVPNHVKVQTLNSLGHGAWMRMIDGRVNLNPHKNRDIVKTSKAILEKTDEPTLRKLMSPIVTLMRLAKAVGLVPEDCHDEAEGLVEDTQENWLHLIDHFDVQFNGIDHKDEIILRDAAIELARIGLSESLNMWNEIDFDDQLYMSVVFGASLAKYDFVFVDEAQDVSSIQLELLSRAVKTRGGRLIAVGDSAQAIYGFRGADSKALNNISKRFKAKTLPLSISYRCAKNVVAEAQRFVSHIEPSETAPEGSVEDWGQLNEECIAKMNDDDMLVCRNTAPLVSTAFQLISCDRRCFVLGRDIGTGIVALLKKMKTDDVVELRSRLETWFINERRLLLEKDPEANCQKIEDKYECTKLFIEKSNATDTAGVIACVEAMFGDKKTPGIILCTVHKAKGLEANRVFILDSFLMPSKYAKKDWQKVQECNIQYVATTRAKTQLVYITTSSRKLRKRT